MGAAPWTQEERDQLAALINEGKSFGEIGKIMKKTRSAIAGAVQRAGLKSLNPQTQMPSRKGVKRKPTAPKKVAEAPVDLDAPEIDDTPSVVETLIDRASGGEPRPVTLLDLRPGQCRCVTGSDEDTGLATFCAEPVSTPGGSWCAEHRAIFFPTRAPCAKAQVNRVSLRPVVPVLVRGSR